MFERLQLATDQLQKVCKMYGMKINSERCKVISDSTSNLTIENKEIEIVKEFKFLGSLVPNSPDDVKRRITFANSAFGRLKKRVWSRREISVKLKLRPYNALILPIAVIWF